MTFESVKVRIENENFFRDNTSLKIRNYWHPATNFIKRKVESKFVSTETTFFAFRACGNSTVRISVKERDKPGWRTEGYYCHMTDKISKKQPNLNPETQEVDDDPNSLLFPEPKKLRRDSNNSVRSNADRSPPLNGQMIHNHQGPEKMDTLQSSA